MIALRQVVQQCVGQVLRVRVAKRDDDQGEIGLSRTKKELLVRMVRLNPEGIERIVRIMHIALGNTALCHRYLDGVRLAVDEERQGKAGNHYQDGEDDVAEDDRDNGDRERDNADRPEPIRASLLVFMLVSFPFDLEWRQFFLH